MSKPHAQLLFMNKTHAKFQKGQNKTVGGDVLTKYRLNASEMQKITSWKKKWQ